MPDPKTIEAFLNSPVTQRTLRYLTEPDGRGNCLLLDIFRKYGRDDLSVRDRVKYAVPFTLIEFVRKRAGASVESVRDKVLGHPARARGLVNTARGIGLYGLTRPQIWYAPLMVVWNLTQACNFHCVHCYQNASHRLPDELNADEQKRILDELAANYVAMLAFSGGEPMMSPHFWPTLEYAGKKGFHLSLATNGSLLTVERASRVGGVGVNFIEISVDSVKSEHHDRFRGGPGLWDAAVAGIRAAVRARTEFGQTFKVGLAATITRDNFHELEDLISFAKDLGCNSFYAFNFIPTGRARNITETDLTPAQRERMVEILYAHMCSRDIGIITSSPQVCRWCVQHASGDGVFSTGHYGYGPGVGAMIVSQYVGGCGAGRCYFAIQPDGKVTPCVFMPKVVGDLRTQSLQDIWTQSPEMDLLRDRERRHGHCKVCDFKYYCGGCRARSYGYYGRMDLSDPGCSLNQKAWDELTPEAFPVTDAAAR